MTIHARPKDQKPLSSYKQKELTNFFAPLMEWGQKEKVTKEQLYEK